MAVYDKFNNRVWWTIFDSGCRADVETAGKWGSITRKSRGRAWGPYIARHGGPSKAPIYLHRFLTSAPSDRWVDHLNGNTLDNRGTNLAVVLPQANVWNTKIDFGVRQEGNRWVAKIQRKFETEAGARLQRQLWEEARLPIEEGL